MKKDVEYEMGLKVLKWINEKPEQARWFALIHEMRKLVDECSDCGEKVSEEV